MTKYEKYLQASERGMQFILKQMDKNGEFLDSEVNNDVASMYKLPNQLAFSGRALEASRSLDYIKNKFMQPNGDFLSYPRKEGREAKTVSWALTYYWAYINGWIALSSQRVGRFDISYSAFNYIRSFWCPIQNAFTWFEPFDSAKEGKGIDQSVCLFQTAHLASVCLYFGDIEKARLAGDFLIKALDGQPDLDQEMCLKVCADTGDVMNSGYPEDKAVFFSVKRNVGGQVYFQLGYPVIFLHRLYKATGEDKYLDTAKIILDFASDCHENIYTFPMSHKVMFGAALLASTTGSTKYKAMAERIADNILSLQAEDGRFLVGDSLMEQLDQTAENVGWLRNVYTELQVFK